MPVPERGEARARRLNELTQDIAGRLRPACREMSPEEFQAMVRAIAERTYRWEIGHPDLRKFGD